MAGFERKVTPATETLPPNSNLAPFSFRVEGIRLTQSRGRLVVVNYFSRRLVVWPMFLLLSTIPLNKYFVAGFPPLSYWANLLHHATWQAILSAVLPARWELSGVDLAVPLIFAMLYWLAVLGGINGVVLNQRNGTAKTGGTTRPLPNVEAVSVVATRFVGKPGPSGRVWMVELLWSKTPETSLIGFFPLETEADRFANAIAQFVNIPVRHEIRKK